MAGKQKRRLCAFCGRPGASNEHIIAGWIGRSLRSTASPDAVINFRHRSANPEAGIGLREKNAKGTAFKTRAICRECNGGWMADLEGAVKPTLEPMLHGRSVLLDGPARKVLALWVTKTTLAFQTIEAEQTKFARPQDFQGLFETRRTPETSQVWLAACPSGNEILYRAHAARLHTSPEDRVDGFGSTLIVGHACFYLLQGFERGFDLRLRNSLSGAMRSLGEGKSGAQEWPPRMRLSPDPVHGLTEIVTANSVLGESSNG